MGRKRPDNAEWRMELRLRRLLKKLFYKIAVFLVKVIVIVLVLYFIWMTILYLGKKDFVLFIFDVTVDTGKFVLTRLQNNTMVS